MKLVAYLGYISDTLTLIMQFGRRAKLDRRRTFQRFTQRIYTFQFFVQWVNIF